MNIVIKGADFSEVAIGNVGKVDRNAILTYAFFNSSESLAFMPSNIYKMVIFDISQYPTGQKFNITGVSGGSTSAGTVAMFTTGTAPTQDITLASSSGDEPSLSTFKTNNFGTRLNPKIQVGSSDDYSKLVTVEVTKPEGANSLYVNAWAFDQQSKVDNIVVIEKNT